MHIAVAGAGIGGLTAALALAGTGARVTLLERRSKPAEFGAGVQVSPNATRVLAALGLLEAVQDEAVEPEGVRLRRARDGAEIATIPMGATARVRYGAPFLLVLRPVLQRILLAAAKRAGITLVFGRGLNELSCEAGEMVILETSQGSLRVDGFVDARGLADAPKRSSGRTAWRALVSAAGLPAAERLPRTSLWLGPRTHLVHYPLPDGERLNVVAITEAAPSDGHVEDPWSQPADPHSLRRAFTGWHDSALALLRPDSEWRRWPLFEADPLPRWSTGRITVLGDAAHPMLPFLAQGASQAIEDAGALARMLRRDGAIAPAFAAYEAERRPHTARVQNASRQQGIIYHLGRPAADVRDAGLRLLGGQRALARLDWLYGPHHVAGAGPQR